jgi:hypothetical protein
LRRSGETLYFPESGHHHGKPFPPHISSPLRNSCVQERSRGASIYAVSTPHRTQGRQFFSHASTALCAYLGKPRTKSRPASLSSFFFGFERPVLDCRVPLQAQHSCGFTRLIHSSTHNEYYYWIYLSFHSVFLEAFSPHQALESHANRRPHVAHPGPKYSQPRRLAETARTP